MDLLPIDFKLTKLVYLSYCFGLTREGVWIASALSCTQPLFKPLAPGDRDAVLKRMFHFGSSGSDVLALLKVLELRNNRSVMSECKISREAVQNVVKIHGDLTSKLEPLGIRMETSPFYAHSPLKRRLMLYVLVSAAFYPNYFTTVPVDDKEFDVFATGLDRRKCVEFTGIPHDESSRKSFEEDVKNVFQRVCPVKTLHREGDKTFVEFGGLGSDDLGPCGLSPGVTAAMAFQNTFGVRMFDSASHRNQAQQNVEDLAGMCSNFYVSTSVLEVLPSKETTSLKVGDNFMVFCAVADSNQYISVKITTSESVNFEFY
jgi:hypothetical protein